MTYFKARLINSDEGMQVQFKELHSIHETNCYAYCVDSWNYPIPSQRKKPGESDLQAAKRIGCKITRIHKEGSRIAFKSKDKAFQQLLLMKRRQISHMRRDIDLLSYFIDRVNEKGLSTLEEDPTKYQNGTIHTLPNSTEKLLEYYVFD